MLIRNGSPKSNDRIPMKDLTIDDLDKPTLAMFRQLVEARYPDGAYEDMKMQERSFSSASTTRSSDTMIPIRSATSITGDQLTAGAIG